MNQPKQRKIMLNYSPVSQKAIDFHNSTAQTKLIVGGFSSGKSHACIAEVLMHMTQNKEMIGGIAWLVGRDAAHCEQTLLPIVKQILTWDGKKAHLGAVENKDYWIKQNPLQITLWNGSKIIFKSLESTSLRGNNIHCAFVDEVSEVDISVWNEVNNRARKCNSSFVAGASNPSNRSHFLFTDLGFEFKEKNGVNPENTWLDIWSTYDNKNNPESYIERLKMRVYTTELAQRRALSGDFIDMTGCVFDTFDRERHTRNREEVIVKSTFSIYASIDHGFNDATCYLQIAITDDDRYIVFFEHYKSGWTPKQHAEIIKKQISPQIKMPIKIFSDHQLQTMESYKHDFGIQNMVLADKGPDSIMYGIQLVQRLLNEDRLIITRNCVNLIREMESYQWRKQIRLGQTKEIPVGSDHALDSLRMCLASLEQKTSFETLSFYDYKPELVTATKIESQFIGYNYLGEPIWS
jgi:PBSX family phage terminase large subunit